ncbi:MAG: C1 family peptidase [Paludibacter sp.]|nr:C1 family peptidase [Bacteroidales bacterium]MCM1069960.1 C1 family peptidase [Prevotella sp.]MCM1354554.1 C1 family peptidase [Bacteroides sp.]MCM1443565.1 C1 family peptidase [Muribaculum sp.]MCM1482637.1 C1 family peptidase [Paludibacter sp.]
MKKELMTMACAMLLVLSVSAQVTAEESKLDSGFVFTTVKENAITSVKNQNRSSTCWSFSTIGFLESELLRMGKGEYDLSEMFVVHHTMLDRAVNYVRYHGESSFSPGGSTYDIIYCMEHYGLVPQEVMPGIMYGDTLPNHNELDAVAGAYVNAIAKGKWKKLSNVWLRGLSAIYDTYLGGCPDEFVYGGKRYTPQSFVDMLGLNADDYVSLTSYTHHPFYESFVIEVPDNWRMERSYNLPLDELMEVFDYAIDKGYTIAWGSDVSETGFTRKGIGVMPDADKGADLTGSDMAHWLGLSETDKRAELTKRPLPEMEITQEMRQEAYDNWETTDDHGMLIYGLAQDQNGKEYYMVKNSWGTEKSDYQGIWYVSKAFVAYKTMNILVHKNAIPKDIRKKLGIK